MGPEKSRSLCVGASNCYAKVDACIPRQDIGAIPELAGDPFQFFVGG
jgi:hypothetical protein